MVSEMLRVLDEDVLDLLADAIKIRIPNREDDAEEANTGARNSRFVQFPYDDNIDRRDGLGTKRRRNTVHVENGLTLSCVVDPLCPSVARSAWACSGGGSGVCPPRAVHWSLVQGIWTAEIREEPCSSSTKGVLAAPIDPVARSAWPCSGGVLGGPADPPDADNCRDAQWKKHEVSMLAKIPNARLVKDFRPIAVLPVIYKLYSRVMYMLAENTCDRLYAPQFAFRKFHQAHEVVFIMRQLIEKTPSSGKPPRSSSWMGTSRRLTIMPRTPCSPKPQEAGACTRSSFTLGYGSGEA